MPPADQILKVTSLTRLIKLQLEENLARVWVKGEVSNLRKQSSGHVYFSLKDDGSQLPCALFARDAARQTFELENGMELILLGDISVFEPHGRYQLIAKIAIQSGEGRLQLEFERLKRKLAAEGLFESDRKKPLPILPTKVVVITSPTGAAVLDFLRILRRRNFGGEVVIFPARVQGRGSSEEIQAMLQHVAASDVFDLVVLTRGGGSIEDLWTFNEEAVARAVAACPIPVISAIGHEIDHVLTDYAADKRAETPSGAAELISSLYLDAHRRYKNAHQEIRQWAEGYLSESRTCLRNFDSRMRIIAPERRVQHHSMQLDEIENRISRVLSKRITDEQQTLAQLIQRITEQHPRTRLRLAKQSLNESSRRHKRAKDLDTNRIKDRLLNLQQRLESGSLQATLKRGFAIIQSKDGRIIDCARKAKKEPSLSARFHDGKVYLKKDA